MPTGKVCIDWVSRAGKSVISIPCETNSFHHHGAWSQQRCLSPFQLINRRGSVQVLRYKPPKKDGCAVDSFNYRRPQLGWC